MPEQPQHRQPPWVPSEAEVRAMAARQIQEIDKYKWCLGERIGHDPLHDRSYNEIAQEWIDRYAARFRTDWTRLVEDERLRRLASPPATAPDARR